MARGLPSGVSQPGRGFPTISAPAQSADDVRGAAIYAGKCNACQGSDGAGRVVASQVYLPLWRAKSFNRGAGMATIDKATAFIHANMPPIREGSLAVQPAWHVATYIDGKVRPQDPRYAGSPWATRQRYHDSPFSRYGMVVAGHRLGDNRMLLDRRVAVISGRA